MAPAPIFISHRSEYGHIARTLKQVIETASEGHIDVFISEDIPRGDEWRPSIEQHLREAQSLLLVYGAPYEDWSWCFYEAGYFAAVDPAQADRHIYCLIRPEVKPPGPLSHLQMVTTKDQLIKELIDIFTRSGLKFEAGDLREAIGKLDRGLFGEIREFEGYPRVHFVACDAELANGKIPTTAQFTGDDNVLGDLFTIQAPSVPWCKVEKLANSDAGQENFVYKWLEETAQIVLAARENQIIAPQAVLIGRNGRRFRTLLYRARIQGEGTYCCEFLAIEEVGGPLTGLPGKHLALLTAIRMGYRFRSDVILKFPADFDAQSPKERERRIQQIPRTIEDLTVESRTRGNITREEFLAAFDDTESDRLSRLLDCWPILAREMYKSLGLSDDGKSVLRPGLIGPDVDRYRTALNAMRLLNIEFLSRSCARVAQMMSRSEKDLAEGARQLEDAIKVLTSSDVKSAA